MLSIRPPLPLFAWRALHGAIPCLVVLANKHILNEVNCPMCQTETEDIRHILFSCSRAREVWSSLGIWQHIESLLLIDRSGSVLIQEIIRRGGEEEKLKLGLPELILTGCWHIWWQRRQLVHGEVIQIPARAIDCSYCDKLCGCNTEIDCKQSRLAEAFRGMFDDQH